MNLDGLTFHNLPEAAHRFTFPGPYYLTIHPSQHGQALMAAIENARQRGPAITIYHSDQQTPGQWHLSTEPLPMSRPAPSYDEDDE